MNALGRCVSENKNTRRLQGDDDWSCTHLWNVGLFQRYCSALYPLRLVSSYSYTISTNVLEWNVIENVLKMVCTLQGCGTQPSTCSNLGYSLRDCGPVFTPATDTQFVFNTLHPDRTWDIPILLSKRCWWRFLPRQSGKSVKLATNFNFPH
jgi:hypothetical protein